MNTDPQVSLIYDVDNYGAANFQLFDDPANCQFRKKLISTRRDL